MSRAPDPVTLHPVSVSGAVAKPPKVPLESKAVPTHSWQAEKYGICEFDEAGCTARGFSTR